MRVEELLCSSHSKQKTSLGEAGMLGAQKRNMIGHLYNLHSMVPSFQLCAPEEIEDGVSTFCRRLAASLHDLAAALRKGIGGVLSECMTPVCEIRTAFEEKLDSSDLQIAGYSSGDQ